MTTVIRAPDGRRLALEEWGAPGGRPVFLLHGTPGSRLGPRPWLTEFHRLGIRVISFDRPGYGRSDAKPGRLVADIAADVRRIADFLGLTEFAVLGGSGGGPHALACAALLRGRVSRCAVFSTLAPPDAEGLDWFAGMGRSNTHEYLALRRDGRLVAGRFRAAAERIRADPLSHVAAIYTDLTPSDRSVVADSGIREMLCATYVEAFRTSEDGWVDDLLAFCAPWGFDVGDIAVPTLLWHGAEDRFAPAAHAVWLAAGIPTSTLLVQSGLAHFDALTMLPRLFAWLNTQDRMPVAACGHRLIRRPVRLLNHLFGRAH